MKQALLKRAIAAEWGTVRLGKPLWSGYLSSSLSDVSCLKDAQSTQGRNELVTLYNKEKVTN